VQKELTQGQRSAIDLGPLVVFFAANYLYGIMVGTAALMAATIIAIGVTYTMERTIPPMPALTCVFVMIFGGLTLYFDNELFIKIKPTIVNLLFASALTTGILLRRNLMKIMLGRVMKLSDEGWLLMTKRWIGMFVVLAVVNEAVWRSVDTDTWVSFKAFGIPVLVIIFSIVMVMPIVQKHQTNDTDND
jgi:intracellular septation protein